MLRRRLAHGGDRGDICALCAGMPGLWRSAGGKLPQVQQQDEAIARTQTTAEVDVRAELTSIPARSGRIAIPLGCVTSPPGQARVGRAVSVAFDRPPSLRKSANLRSSFDGSPA